MRFLVMISLLAAFMLGSRSSAFALGGMEGGGGKGVVCGTQVRVLDLYEAEAIHRLPIPSNQDDLDTNIANHATALAYYQSETGFDQSNDFYKKLILKFHKTEIIDRFSDIPKGTRLPFTPDASLPTLPNGCSFVQIAIYADDADVIHRDREYWDRLSIQDQAALVLHEGIYRTARNQGASLSDDTRYIVGLVFAHQLPEPMLRPLWDAPSAWWCGTRSGDGKNPNAESFELYAINESRNGQSGVGIYFVTFKNFVQYERTSAFAPGVTLQDLLISKANFVVPVHSTLTRRDWVLEYDGQSFPSYNVAKTRAWRPVESATEFSTVECELRR